MRGTNLGRASGLAALAILVGSCADRATAPTKQKINQLTAPNGTLVQNLGAITTSTPEAGYVKVCKTAASTVGGTFNATLTPANNNSGTGEDQNDLVVSPTECRIIARDFQGENTGQIPYLPAGSIFTLSETAAPNTIQSLDSCQEIDPASDCNTPDKVVNFYHGWVFTYTNSTHVIPPCPAGSFTFFYSANGDLNIVYDQFPAPNDNSYGVNAVGWPNGHTFGNLTGSDHAGFQLRDGGGVVQLSFNIDYLSAKTGTPSGYASLGPFGGDGKVLIGTLAAGDIVYSTSLDRNLNTLGYFSGGTQVPATKSATNGTDLLVNSPATVNTTNDYTLKSPNPWVNGWDFHDTYFVTIKAAKLASIGFNSATWKVEPNLDQLHNSPAKPCPVADAGPCDLSVTKYEVKDKQVKVTIANNGSVAEFLTALSLTWPSATNGKLVQVKLDGDVIYDNPDIAGGSANLTLAQLVADQNKRKIDKASSDVLTFIFENNADTVLSHYTSTVKFGDDCVKTILPPP